MRKYILPILIVILAFTSLHFAKAQSSLQFIELWEHSLFPRNPYTVEYDQLNRDYFYVANDVGGLLIFQIEEDNNHTLINSFDIENWDSLQVMNVFQRDHYLFLALGSFFNDKGQDFGLAIIDVTDPEDAHISDIWTHGQLKKGSAIAIANESYAFLGAMNDGVYIFDIRDPSNISQISHILPKRDFPVQNPNAIQEPNARGMALKDDYLFLCYDAGGIRVIDISDITMPKEVHTYINESLLNVTQQAYNNIVIHDNLAYVATDFCGMEVLDISDPLNIERLSWWNPWHCESPDNFWVNSPGHTNEIDFISNWVPYSLILLNGNDAELLALNVRDPSNPKLIGEFGETGDNIRTWGFGIRDRKVMAAYYFTLLPWVSAQAKLKEFRIETPLATENLEADDFNIYPNPSSDYINVILDKSLGTSAHYKIINRFGKLVSYDNLPTYNQSFTIPVYNLEPGLYILQIIADKSSHVQSFVHIPSH